MRQIKNFYCLTQTYKVVKFCPSNLAKQILYDFYASTFSSVENVSRWLMYLMNALLVVFTDLRISWNVGNSPVIGHIRTTWPIWS